jgi:hypothetical protein
VGGRAGNPLCNGTRQQHRILKRGRGIGEEQREGYAEPRGELDHLSGNRGDRGDRVGRLDLRAKQLKSSDDSGESFKYGAFDNRGV